MEIKKLSWVRVLILLGFFLVILIIVWGTGLKKPESSTVVEIPTLVKADVEFLVNQAVLVGIDSSSVVFNPGGVHLFIPANALNKFGQISFIPKEADLLAEAGEPGWKRPIVYNIEFKDSFGGVMEVDINGFIEVCFMLDEILWADYQERPEKFEVQFYDESQSPIQWVSLQKNTYPSRQQICGETNHFSLFSLAYQEPATPTPSPSATSESTETATQTPLETETPDGVYEP